MDQPVFDPGLKESEDTTTRVSSPDGNESVYTHMKDVPRVSRHLLQPAISIPSQSHQTRTWDRIQWP